MQFVDGSAWSNQLRGPPLLPLATAPGVVQNATAGSSSSLLDWTEAMRELLIIISSIFGAGLVFLTMVLINRYRVVRAHHAEINAYLESLEMQRQDEERAQAAMEQQRRLQRRQERQRERELRAQERHRERRANGQGAGSSGARDRGGSSEPVARASGGGAESAGARSSSRPRGRRARGAGAAAAEMATASAAQAGEGPAPAAQEDEEAGRVVSDGEEFEGGDGLIGASEDAPVHESGAGTEATASQPAGGSSPQPRARAQSAGGGGPSSGGQHQRGAQLLLSIGSDGAASEVGSARPGDGEEQELGLSDEDISERRRDSSLQQQ